jgi:hypothetical protein
MVQCRGVITFWYTQQLTAEVWADGSCVAWLSAAADIDRCFMQLSQRLAQILAVRTRQGCDERSEILALLPAVSPLHDSRVGANVMSASLG